MQHFSVRIEHKHLYGGLTKAEEGRCRVHFGGDALRITMPVEGGRLGERVVVLDRNETYELIRVGGEAGEWGRDPV